MGLGPICMTQECVRLWAVINCERNLYMGHSSQFITDHNVTRVWAYSREQVYFYKLNELAKIIHTSR